MEHPQPVVHAAEDTAPMLGLDEIRLVRILPGSEDDPLSCEMQRFPTSPCPAYTALPYLGETRPSPKQYLSTRGNMKSQQISGLPFVIHAYPYRATTFFWIDAMCIAQDSVEERSRHILRMKDIYLPQLERGSGLPLTTVIKQWIL